MCSQALPRAWRLQQLMVMSDKMTRLKYPIELLLLHSKRQELFFIFRSYAVALFCISKMRFLLAAAL